MNLTHPANGRSTDDDATAPIDPGSIVDLNVMVRTALNQAAPHIHWTVAHEEVLRFCSACHGFGIEQIAPTMFHGCDACLGSDVKICIVRTAEHAKEISDPGLTQFLSHVPETAIPDEVRALLIDDTRREDLCGDVEEVWVAIRGDATYGQGASPIEAFLNVEQMCEDRDSVLALLARRAKAIPEEVHAKVVQIVARKLHSA
jgi:hypothetical protein